jgi:hypothetical protein
MRVKSGVRVRHEVAGGIVTLGCHTGSANPVGPSPAFLQLQRLYNGCDNLLGRRWQLISVRDTSQRTKGHAGPLPRMAFFVGSPL